MKGIIIFLTGLTVGGTLGYFVSKKKADAKIKNIESTYKELMKKREEKAVEAETETDDAGDEPETANESNDTENAEEDEDDDDEDSDEYGPYVKYEDDSDDEDSDWYDRYYGDDEETRKAKEEFRKEVESYIGSGQSYNITADMYEDKNDGFIKRVMMIDDVDKVEMAYDPETGEEIENYLEITMAYDNDTLNEQKCDDEGRLFVRCEEINTDFEIKWARWESLPPWIDEIEDDGTD